MLVAYQSLATIHHRSIKLSARNRLAVSLNRQSPFGVLMDVV
jgi:hypothetical protein